MLAWDWAILECHIFSFALWQSKMKRNFLCPEEFATTWVVISLAVAVLIGVIGLGMTEAGSLEMLQGSNSETIIVKIAVF